jgi:hypothetical protein
MGIHSTPFPPLQRTRPRASNRDRQHVVFAAYTTPEESAFARKSGVVRTRRYSNDSQLAAKRVDITGASDRVQLSKADRTNQGCSRPRRRDIARFVNAATAGAVPIFTSDNGASRPLRRDRFVTGPGPPTAARRVRPHFARLEPAGWWRYATDSTQPHQTHSARDRTGDGGYLGLSCRQLRCRATGESDLLTLGAQHPATSIQLG